MVTLLALCVSYLGGVEKVVLALVMLVIGPMIIPAVWGLFSPRIGPKSVWVAVLVAAAVAGGSKLAIAYSLLPGSALLGWIATHGQLTNAMVGFLVPVGAMLLQELGARGTSPGWKRLAEHQARYEPPAAEGRVSTLPAMIVAGTIAMLAVLGLGASEQRGVLLLFSALLLLVGGIIVWVYRRQARMSSDPQ